MITWYGLIISGTLRFNDSSIQVVDVRLFGGGSLIKLPCLYELLMSTPSQLLVFSCALAYFE